MRIVVSFLVFCLLLSSCGKAEKVGESVPAMGGVLTELNLALSGYDPFALDKVVGAGDGDSYLAQEWAYANGVPLHEEYLKRVGAVTRVSEGSVTTVDYSAVMSSLDKDYIRKLYHAAGLSEGGYDFANGMFLLYLQYMCDRKDWPLHEVSFSDIVVDGGRFASDAGLDDLLFASDSLHELLTEFSKAAVGFTGTKVEKYITKEKASNPEYVEWSTLFNERYAADGGIFVKGGSLWEPFYLRNSKNEIVKDENGGNVVDYYVVKRDDGTDWVQPAVEIEVDVEKERVVPDSWELERGVGFNTMGVHWLSTGYNGSGSTRVRFGNGLRERPLGVGTSYKSKMRDKAGVYRDVEVTLLGYWLGEDAISYVERISTRNRGFTVDNIVKLICFEVSVRNLGAEPLEYIGTELALCDAGGNVSPRNGVLYGFSDSGVIAPGEVVVLNDWATSTEIDRKYICWGETFGKEYPVLYYNALAGRVEVPSYSHYKEFDGVGVHQGK